MSRQAFDIARLADNGLKRGWTTGTCATAAIKAALYLLRQGKTCTQVQVSLPDPDYYLTVPVQAVRLVDGDSARAEVVKDGGDDPDNTHGAVICAVVRPNHSGRTRFLAGPGVGTVTQPGIRVPVGEPAINPTPRRMMQQAIDEVLEGEPDPGFDLSIGCEGGETLAKKTFNPRLGILGGISIIGTTGIVEPMSMAAYMASIEVYIRVALADDPECVAYAPGKIGTAYLRRTLQLPTRRMVQISNFIGFATDTTEQVLTEEGRRLRCLWLVGHPGKLAKVLQDVWDTHSSKSTLATAAIAQVAADIGISDPMLERLRHSNTVEMAVELLHTQPFERRLWNEVERRVAARVHSRLAHVDQVEVRLFGLKGTGLGRDV